MPSMIEIYQKHSFEYDELVSHEDVTNNLGRWLLENIDWKDKVVCEAGAGTGRVTLCYIDKVKKAFLFDRSSRMLQTLGRNLSRYPDKMVVCESDHLNISLVEKADIFIEGWSFGHAVIENAHRVDEIIASLETMIQNNLREDGTSIIIETLGTNVDVPNPPEKLLAYYYKMLEEEYGYFRTTVKTNYLFESVEQAGRIMGFFFGDEMRTKILREGKREIPEFTGVWMK